MSQATPTHPLLALTPPARRTLARTLVTGLAGYLDSERKVRSRRGGIAVAACLGTGGVLFAGWHVLTGGALAPFAAWYGLGLAIQAGVGSALAAREVFAEQPLLRAGVLAPYALWRAAAAWVWPPRFTADRLLLAAGILVAARRPISFHLLRRLYGRAFPQLEADRAIALLRHIGYLERGAAEAAGVLVLTPVGAQLLRDLEVPLPAPRTRQDPVVAPHLLPVFAALDTQPGPARVRPPEPPVVNLPVLVASVPPPMLVPEPLPPLVVEEEPEDEALEPREPARPLPWRRLVRPLGAVAAIAVLAVGVWLARPYWPFGQPTPTLSLSSSAMPNSRGTAMQFNGRGLMLSSYDGGLFLSVPERLDYKRPLTFRGFDMATGCGVISRPVRTASISPQGRFVWLEMGGSGHDGPLERCLADLETKTITHDLIAHNKLYGLPRLLGWSGPSAVMLADTGEADHWWRIDVTNHQAQQIALPHHSRILPLPIDAGDLLLAGLDLERRGRWALTTYFPSGATYEKLTSLTLELPDALKEFDPTGAALSPDKRYLLLALRPLAPTARTGALVVVDLNGGRTEPLKADAPPLVDSSIFWGPDDRGGRYRFYYNGLGPDGPVPCAGELLANGT